MADGVACIQERPLDFENATPSLDAERTLSPPGTRPSRRIVLKRMFQRSSTLRVLSLNMGGLHRNPLEFELRGESSERAAQAMAVLRRSGKALRDSRYGPRSMTEPERDLVAEIMAEIFSKAESEWHRHTEEALQCQTWALVLSYVNARQPQLFDALNAPTLALLRPSVFENPGSCRTFTNSVEYLAAWLEWYRGLDRAGDFWRQEAPRCVGQHGMELSAGFAGLLLFDLMCLCAAQCAMGEPGQAEPGSATHSHKAVREEARDVPFREIKEFTSQLPAFNSKARHECAWTLIQRLGAHVLFAQRVGRLFEHGGLAEAFLPPFYASDGRTAVFLKRGSFSNATDISAAIRAKMEDRIDLEAQEHSRAAWQAACSALAAVYCQYQLKVESLQACLVSLHCPHAEIVGGFLEALRAVLVPYAADVNIVGLGSCCTGKESAILQRKLRSAGFEIGRQVDQVTVAKQRTHFQTQVQKAGEADVAHTDYVLSWGSARLRRGETLYTPDVRTAYGVDQESKQCIRFPTIRWPYDHCSIAASFELRKRCTLARLFQWRAIRALTAMAVVLFILLLPVFSMEHESPYGPPGTWFHDNWPGTPRVGICEVPLPCQGGWSWSDHGCYKATPKLAYGDAERFCHEHDSVLVSIGSEAENDFVTEIMCPPGQFCWIGLRSDIDRQRFWWTSGEPLVYDRLVGAQGRLFPLFPLSRAREREATVVSTISSDTSGCRVVEFLVANADFPQDLLWVRMLGVGFALAVSAVLLILPQPQLLQTRAFLWTTFVLNILWYLSSVFGYCAAEDIESLGFAFSFTSLIDAGATAILAMWAYWIILRRICVLYSATVPLTVFSLLSVTMSLWAVSFLLFVDSATTLSPSVPVLLSFSLTGLLSILYLVFAASIASKLYQTWASLKREATTGCSKEGGYELSSQERAAQIHFFSVLTAIITGAFRWTALLAWLLEATQHRFVLWTRFATSVAMALDVIANNLCAYLLAVLDMDDSVIHASGITAEVVKRASLEVEQHQLAVQLLKAAPTSKSQLRHLALLERKARSSSQGNGDQEPVLVFHAAVQAETSRIHWLMRCVRLRAMTMPLRYQYLMDTPTIQGEPRQHVPAQFAAGGESEDDENEYFSWLYDCADAVQPIFFQQVAQLVKTFNNNTWPSCLGLVPEQYPWMIWANGGSSGISTHLLHSAAVISPGDILFHSPARTSLGRLTCSPCAHCIVLEETTSHVSIHRSGSAYPQEVARAELRSCSGGAVFVPGPKKKRQRCLEKIDADYQGKEPWPAAASLVDICRCMILLDDPYAIAVLVAYIRNTMRVVRLKNRFSEDVLEVIDPEDLQAMFYDAATQLPDGSRGVTNDHVEDRQYRDISINVEIIGPQGYPCICEIQVTLSNLAILKHADTSLYTIRRMQTLKELQTSHVFSEAARRARDS